MKRYYVIAPGPNGDGEQVYPFPVTGSETVLDAVANVPGLAAKAAVGRVYVVRSAGAAGQTLPVDWAGITRDGKSQTNYQLLPGDRLYVAEK